MPLKDQINKELTDLFNAGEARHAELVEISTRKLVKAYQESLLIVQAIIADMYNKADGNPNLQFMRGFNRLQRLEQAIIAELLRLKGKVTRTVTNGGVEAYRNAYYTIGYATESTFDVLLGFGEVSTETVLANINNAYTFINWQPKTAINARTASLNARLTQTINTALIQGFDPKTAARNIEIEFSKSVSNDMVRILRTEMLRAQSAGTLQGFNTSESFAKKKGIDFGRTWISTIDSRTRPARKRRKGRFVQVGASNPDHRYLDGKKAKIRKNDNWDVPTFRSKDGLYSPAPGYWGVASMDINCRCSLIAQIGNITPNVVELQENRKGGMTFEDWQESKGVTNAPV